MKKPNIHRIAGVASVLGVLALAAAYAGPPIYNIYSFYSVLTGNEIIADQGNPTGASFTTSLLRGTNNGVSAQTGATYTFLGTGTGAALATADAGKLITFNHASAVAASLPQAGSAGFAANVCWQVQNLGAGSVTITPVVSTINGASTLVISTNSGSGICSDGVNYQVESGGAAGGVPAVLAPITTGISYTNTGTGAVGTVGAYQANGIVVPFIPGAAPTGGDSAGIQFSETAIGPSVSTVAPVPWGLGNDLNVTGSGNNISGTTDLLSFYTQIDMNGTGTWPEDKGMESSVYVIGTGTQTLSDSRSYFSNFGITDANATVSKHAFYSYTMSAQAGILSTLTGFLCPNLTSTFPIGGSAGDIGSYTCLLNSDANAIISTAGLMLVQNAIRMQGTVARNVVAGEIVINGLVTQPSFTTDGGSIHVEAANGIVSSGLGSTNDWTVKNSAGGIALAVPTGTQNIVNPGAATIGSATTAVVATGELAGAKITASGSAPGAGFGKMEWVAGTSGGTCKLIAYAGTSTTPTTIIDNVGAGC